MPSPTEEGEGRGCLRKEEAIGQAEKVEQQLLESMVYLVGEGSHLKKPLAMSHELHSPVSEPQSLVSASCQHSLFLENWFY